MLWAIHNVKLAERTSGVPFGIRPLIYLQQCMRVAFIHNC